MFLGISICCKRNTLSGGECPSFANELALLFILKRVLKAMKEHVCEQLQRARDAGDVTYVEVCQDPDET